MQDTLRAPILTPCDEGVLYFDSQGLDHLRLFDHDGNYLRTIYPFPASKVLDIPDLEFQVFPQSNQKLPLKKGQARTTLLTSGSSSFRHLSEGIGAISMASHDKRIVISQNKLNYLSLDGSSGGRNLEGPTVELKAKMNTLASFREGIYPVYPRSMAISPNGKWLYLTNYFWDYPSGQGAYNCVTRMPIDGTEPPTLWKGTTEQNKSANAPEDFIQPMWVTCDPKGRVYVADYFNDRIQVFNEDGSFVKSIPSNKPTKVFVDPKNGEIYVFSWIVSNTLDWRAALEKNKKAEEVPFTLIHYGPLEKPDKKVTYDLPGVMWLNGMGGTFPYNHQIKGTPNHIHFGWWLNATMDFNATEPTIWFIPRPVKDKRYDEASFKLYTLKEGKLVLKKDTGEALKKKTPRVDPPALARQRMCVNPATGILYIFEHDASVDKNFSKVTEFNPITGETKLIEVPCVAEDMCIDLNGLAYLRVDQGVIRFDTKTWKEIPWDYGEEASTVRFQSTNGGKAVESVSVLRVPGGRTDPFWHLGGISISTRGHLAVTTYNGGKSGHTTTDSAKQNFKQAVAQTYQPTIYPGRVLSAEIHVYDKHGTVITHDALPGIGITAGIGIGKDDAIYAMVNAHRVVKNQNLEKVFETTATIVKAHLNQGKFLSTGRAKIPLPKADYPNRPFELSGYGTGGDAWLENAEWLYGGVGASFEDQPAPACECWNARFATDYLDRSFAPELKHSSVAVLDSAGNLILRVGRYGNIDEGKPLVQDPDMKNPPESIGGDEVSLFYAPYVTTHTDKRLYIADPGNNRIVCVKLNYHTEEKLSMTNK